MNSVLNQEIYLINMNQNIYGGDKKNTLSSTEECICVVMNIKVCRSNIEYNVLGCRIHL